MTTPEWTTGRVPLIDPATGRFPDAFAPTPVVEALEEIGAIRSDMLARHTNLADVPDAAAARANLGAAPATHSHALEQVTGLTGALDAKADLVDGRIPTSQLPTQALTDAVAVADEAAMLALTVEQVQPGDLAIRADGAGTYVLRDPDPSLLGSWLHLTAPTDAVTSVNGQLGTVVLGAADVGAVTPTQLGEAIEQVEIAAEGWASAASGSATAAAGSATAAASDRGAAQTARSAAESASGIAVAARDEAVPAAATATSARDLAVAARDATLAAVVITGAGRPDVPATMTSAVQALVAAATSGAEFRSTDFPQGARVWRRFGPNWVCVEGDTGWVNPPRFTTVDDAGTNAITWTTYRARRVNERLYIIWSASVATALTTTVNSTLAADPGTGWQPIDGESGYMPVYTSVNMTALAGRCSARPAGRMQGSSIFCNESRLAAPAWPLTLPGA